MLNRVYLTGIHETMATSAILANEFLAKLSCDLLGDPAELEFPMATINLGQVISLHKEMSHLCNPKIALYTPSLFNLVQRKVNGYTSGDYETIHLNSRNLNRYTPAIVGTIVHEYFHCLEFHAQRVHGKWIQFNHGGNSPKGNTLPEYMGYRAAIFAEKMMEKIVQYNEMEKSIQVYDAEREMEQWA